MNRVKPRGPRVLAWNAKVGRNPDDVIRALTLMMSARPHIVEITEATPYGRELHEFAELNGYRRYQLPHVRPPKPRGRRRPQAEDANIAILVRDDVVVRRARAKRMRWRWWGPVHGWEHMPRVYWKMNIRIPERPGLWRLSFGHWPTTRPARNGRPCRETERWVRRWFAAGAFWPSVHVGDLNRSVARLQRLFPHQRVVVGRGPDNALTNRKVGAATIVLPRYGSDHHAVLYSFWRAR